MAANLTLPGVESFWAELTNIEKTKLVYEIYPCKKRHRYTVAWSLHKDTLKSDNSHRHIYREERVEAVKEHLASG